MFIQVDLKAVEVAAPAVARAMGLDVSAVIGSLVLLWHRCWCSKSGTISSLELRGFFQHPEAGSLLEAFGFLEAMEPGQWRIRGAEKYLRVAEAARKGGKARAEQAARAAGKFTSASPAVDQRSASGEGGVSDVSEPDDEHQRSTSGQPAGDQPGHQRSASGTPALSLSTEILRSTDQKPSPKSRREPKQVELVKPPPDPRHAPLVARLTATFERLRGARYPFTGRDAKCITELLAKAEPDAIDAAWSKALVADYPKTATLPELQKNLAHFIGTSPGASKDWRSETADYAAAWGQTP